MVKKFALGSLLVVLLTATAVASGLLLEVHQDVTVFAREATPIPGVKNVLDDVQAGQPQTILAARIRPPLRRRQGQPAALGHDHRRSPGSRQAGDGDDVAPARPQGHDPRARDRQDQRRLPRRRAEAHGADGPGAAAHPDQPRHQRELRRLRARGQPARLRVHGHRPPLLQRPRRPRRLRGHRPQGRLPEALRAGRAELRALPPHRLRLRPRRTPAGVPAPGEGADRPRQALRRSPGAAEDLRPLHADGHRRLQRRGDPAAAEARLRVLEDPAHRDPVPGARRSRRLRRDLARRPQGDRPARSSRSRVASPPAAASRRSPRRSRPRASSRPG